MTPSPQWLYDLLPVLHRERDEQVGAPLKALLATIEDNADLLQADVAALYADLFVETCEPWALPLLAELIGYRLLPAELQAITDDRRRRYPPFARRSVGTAIEDRRRKGTPRQLAALGPDVAGWPALVIEQHMLVAATADIEQADVPPTTFLDLTDLRACEEVDTPFDIQRRLVSISQPQTITTSIEPSLPAVSLAVWRLLSERVPRVPAGPLARVRDEERTRWPERIYTFDWLGRSLPLMPQPGDDAAADTTSNMRADAPIGRAELTGEIDRYYGEGRSLCVWVNDPHQPIPAERVLVADLTALHVRPPKGWIAIDPVTGHLALPQPAGNVWVEYCRPRVTDMGGGGYHRRVSQPADALLRGNDHHLETVVRDALATIMEARPVIVEAEPGRHRVGHRLHLPAGKQVVLRAPDGARVEVVIDEGYLEVRTSPASPGQGTCLTLEGLMLDAVVEVHGELDQLLVRHSTLVPRLHKASLRLLAPVGHVVIDHCVTGGIEVHQGHTRVSINDSIVDRAERGSLYVEDGGTINLLECRASTVLGALVVDQVMVTDSIVMGSCWSKDRRRPAGSVTFSYLDEAADSLRGEGCQPPRGGTPNHVRPVFESLRHGGPGYARLSRSCPSAVSRGAEDGSEMGAYHDLDEAARLTSLAERLEQSLPAAMTISIVLAT